jgi:hypothetical protein
VKRSVMGIKELWTPVKVLELAHRAYSEEFVNEDDRLEHAALVCCLYLGGFRVGEVVPVKEHFKVKYQVKSSIVEKEYSRETFGLRKSQFKQQVSFEGRQFVVIENVPVEKAEGVMRNVPIPPFDPLYTPIAALLDRLGENDQLFSLTRRTAWNILSRTTDGFPHMLRAARNTFLARGFSSDERAKMMGWRRPRSMADRYEFLNWMTYAERLAILTKNYWEHETIPPHLSAWIQSLAVAATNSKPTQG